MLRLQHQDRPWLRGVVDGVDEEFDEGQQEWTADLVHRVLEGKWLEEIPTDGWTDHRLPVHKPQEYVPTYLLQPRAPIEYDLSKIEQLAQYIAKFPHVPSIDQGMEIAKVIAEAAVKYRWPKLDYDYVKIFSLEWMEKARQ